MYNYKLKLGGNLAVELDSPEDSPETEDNSAESLREIANAFNTAVTVSVQFHGHQYKGEVVEIKIGEFLAFRV